ncbi:hypothetical protein AeNC1_009808 [Aphanomyces euteiches]|nr:hypothetical protein AeNC1_009808 [Aphanomyces euteiches]
MSLVVAGGVAAAGVGLFALKQHNDKANIKRFTKPDLVLDVRQSTVAPSSDRCTVLVTGGNGFLGSHIVRQLVEKAQYNVIVFDISLPKSEVLHPEVTYVQGNLLQPDHIRGALEVFKAFDISVETVIHAASLVPALEVTYALSEAVNVQGTQNVLDACAALKVSSLIYTSSVTVVLSPDELVTRKASEDTLGYPRHNIDTYSRTKAAAEKKILAANSAEFTTCSLRPSSIFGKDTVLSDLCMKGDPANVIVGDGKCFNDYVPVEDVANAHVLALQALQTPEGQERLGGQAYFIGGDEENEVRWFQGIGTHGRTDPSLTHWEHPPPNQVPFWLIEVLGWLNEIVFALTGYVILNNQLNASSLQFMKRTFTFSIAKAKRDFGYVPRHTVAEKIALLVDDYTKAKSE